MFFSRCGSQLPSCRICELTSVGANRALPVFHIFILTRGSVHIKVYGSPPSALAVVSHLRQVEQASVSLKDPYGISEGP